MRYHIYKSSIDTYRVWDTLAQEFVFEGVSNLFIQSAKFCVDSEKYDLAKKQRFLNSGDPLDYFAWIGTNCKPVVYQLLPNGLGLVHQIKFNPFKSKFFRLVQGGSEINSSGFVFTVGNNLFAEQKTIR